MQNFTFGRKGTNWFLFAFVLLIGTLPSFGQDDCPDPDNFSFSETQTVCFTQTVSELNTDGYPVYQTDDNANDTQAIPQDELLVDGETYFVGGESGQCERIAITVTVESELLPENRITNDRSSGFTFSNCTPTNFDEGDLSDLFIVDDENNYRIAVYTTEEGSDEFTGELVAGNSYYIAQVPISTIEPGNCPSQRVAFGYDPNQIEAPATETSQTLCEGATVADLEAEGTYNNTQAIRWYRSRNATSPLAAGTELISGQVYYVGQVVNDAGRITPPCETPTVDRAAVAVTLEDFDAGEDASTTLCLSEVEERLEDETPEQLFLSLVAGRDLPTNVSFLPSIQSIASDYSDEPIDTFTTQATFTTEAGCEDTVELSITVEESFEAGDSNLGNILCRSEIGEVDETEVRNYLNSLLSGDADEDGKFSPLPSEIADDLNNTSDEITFDIIYTIGEGTSCEDTANLGVTVLEGADFELVPVTDLCNDDIPALVNEIPEDVEALFLENFGENIPEGDFEEGDIQAVINQYNQNNIDTFTATFIANVENGCSEEIELTRTVIEGETANAGNLVYNEDVCTSDQPIDLTSLTEADSFEGTVGGTFSGEGVSNNVFDPSTVEPDTYTITYRVDESLNCVSGSEETTFTIDVIQGPDAGNDIEDSICVSELESLLADFDPLNPEATLTQLFQRFEWDGEIDGEFSPNVNILGAQLLSYYGDPDRDPELSLNGTYTVGNEADECDTDESTFAITIFDGELIDAGQPNSTEICNITIENGRFPSISSVRNYYLDLLDEGVSRNGTFEPTINEIVNWYNNEAEIGIFSTTYTVGSGECQDSVELSVEVLAPEQAIVEVNDENPIICITENEFNLNTLLSENTLEGGIFTGSEFIDANIFDATTAGIGEFEITYSISEETSECVLGEASKSFTINVIDAQEATAEATNQEIDVCVSETSFDLTTALTAGTTPGGSFTLEEEAFEGTSFDVTQEGTYNFTYNISSENAECIQGNANASFTINVTTESFDAGQPNSTEICNITIENGRFPSISSVRNYYLDLLDEGVSRNGTFEPTINEIVNWYNNEAEIGIFSTTYTVGSGECQDSVELSVEVLAPEQAIVEVNDENPIICITENEFNLNTLLSENTPEGGIFTGSEFIDANIFDATTAGIGEFEITYSISEETSECVLGEASKSFTINVIDAQEATAEATNQEIDVCSSETSYNLNDALSDDSTPGGTFFLDGEEFNGNTFDATSVETGEYSFTYTVSSEDSECIEGSATTDFTINVTSETFDAGDDVTFTVCSVG